MSDAEILALPRTADYVGTQPGPYWHGRRLPWEVYLRKVCEDELQARREARTIGMEQAARMSDLSRQRFERAVRDKWPDDAIARAAVATAFWEAEAITGFYR